MVRGTNLPRSFRQHVETVEILSRAKGQLARFPLVRGSQVRVFLFSVGQVRKLMKSQEDALPVTERNGLAFLDQMVGQAVDATLRELFTAGLAGVLISVAGVFELLASNEELEDELIRLSTHSMGV